MSFSQRRWLVVFHWGVNGSMSPKVSRTLLSILADLNNVVVWMVPASPPISTASWPLIPPVGAVPSAPITIGVNVNFMFPIFFLVLWQGVSSCLYFCFLWFSFSRQPRQKILILFIDSFIFILFIIIIIIIYSLEFFTSILADGLSLEFEWEQVSLNIQDSFQYSSRLQ